jgi:hypothetical protein
MQKVKALLPVELLKSTLFGGSWMNTGPDKSWQLPEKNFIS